MGVVNKLLPLLEIDLGSKKLFYSSQSVKVLDGNSVKQYDGKLKSESGISKSISLTDFKASVAVASNISIVNTDRLQDIFTNNPESFTKVKMTYMYGGDLSDTTAKILEIYGIASNPGWNQLNFNMAIKDSQKLFFKNVPNIIFDANTFQTQFILNDATIGTLSSPIGYMTDPVVTGNPSVPGSRDVTMVHNIVSSSFNNKPQNYWKGTRIDVAMDQRLADDTNNLAGQFAVVIASWDSTVFFNIALDKYLVREDETSMVPINNSMYALYLSTYDPSYLTFLVTRNAMPQNTDSASLPFPILYGAPEKVPMVWSIGQKSTNTNSFGVGDDVYVFAGHPCKLGVIPDPIMVNGLKALGIANNGVYIYSDDGISELSKDQKEIADGLRAEVYWSLEDKRVVDSKILPGKKDWIPNPFPKRWKNSGNNAQNLYQDKLIRLISPLHRIKLFTTLKGDVVHGVQLRGGEFDWFDVSYPFENRGQYNVRYGMGNSKLYISAEGYRDDIDGFYTGNNRIESQYDGNFSFPEDLENSKDNTLIKNPADIMLHFLMNYSSINFDKRFIDVDSFRKSRQMLDGWRFDTGITEIINGQDLLDRFCQQSCSIVFMDNNKFKIKTIIPSKMTPKAYLREFEHISELNFEYTKTEEIFNNFIFQYAYDHPNQRFSKIIERNKKNDVNCRNSFALNGFERSKGVIEFKDINDSYTANLLTDVLVDLYSKRRIYLSCSVAYTGEVIDSKIEIGDCIAITTAQAPNGWNSKPCLVLETNYSSEKLELKVMEI